MKLVGYNIIFTANQLVEPENGWFLFNGAVISQTTYPTLFAQYGSTFNTGGEGVGNFRLPDFTDGKVPIPRGLTNFTSYGLTGGGITASADVGPHPHPDTFSATALAHSHNGSATINSTSYSHQHSNIYLTAASAAGSGGGSLGDVPTATSSPATGFTSHTHSASGSINSTTSANLSISGVISATGGNGTHNNMQPYQVFGGWLVKHG